MGYPWRDPDEESIDLYPGLVVHDGRHSGSITFGRTRLPVNAVIYDALCSGWDVVEEGWTPSAYGWDDKKLAHFLHDLLEMRGEFGRLLLVLANAERLEQEREETVLDAHTEVTGETVINVSPWDPNALRMPPPWWDDPELAAPVVDALRRCLEALERPAPHLPCTDCGGPGVTWEDGFVLCDDCAILRAKKGQMEREKRDGT